MASYRQGTSEGRKLWKRSGKPLAIVVAEAFLILTVILYFVRIVVLSMAAFIEDPEETRVLNLTMLTYIFEIAMIFVTINALLGMSSHRPSGWKTVARSSALLAIMTFIGLVTGHYLSVASLVFRVPEVFPLVAIILILWFTRSVREYYTPPLENTPPLKQWVMFAIGYRMYPKGEYRIIRQEEMEDPETPRSD